MVDATSREHETSPYDRDVATNASLAAEGTSGSDTLGDDPRDGPDSTLRALLEPLLSDRCM
jgi:hypothetical protein